MTGEAGRELLQSMRDVMVRLLRDEYGPHVNRTLGDLAEIARGEDARGIGRTVDADRDGRELIEAGIRLQDRLTVHGDGGSEHGRVPDNVAALLARVHASGVDPGTAARVERAVLNQYQQLRERTLRQEFLNNRSRDLRGRGESADRRCAAGSRVNTATLDRSPARTRLSSRAEHSTAAIGDRCRVSEGASEGLGETWMPRHHPIPAPGDRRAAA